MAAASEAAAAMNVNGSDAEVNATFGFSEEQMEVSLDTVRQHLTSNFADTLVINLSHPLGPISNFSKGNRKLLPFPQESNFSL